MNNPDALAGLIVLVGAFVTSILCATFGFKLLATSHKEEKTIIKFGRFELTLSSMVGSVCTLSALSIVLYLLFKFYPQS
jgi:hypothetical protein